MNTHHVPLRQIVAEIRPEMFVFEGRFSDESYKIDSLLLLSDKPRAKYYLDLFSK